MFYAEEVTKEKIFNSLKRKSLSKPQINELLDILLNIMKGDVAYYIETDEGSFILFISDIKCNCNSPQYKSKKLKSRKRFEPKSPEKK